MEFLTENMLLVAFYVTTFTEVLKTLIPHKWLDNPKVDVRAINLLITFLVLYVLGYETANFFEFMAHGLAISLLSQGEYEVFEDILNK